jgi:hypothetical protein
MKSELQQGVERQFALALEARLRAEYARGKAYGLRSAQVIVNWLNRTPDTKWQQQVREWAKNEIERNERE